MQQGKVQFLTKFLGNFWRNDRRNLQVSPFSYNFVHDQFVRSVSLTARSLATTNDISSSARKMELAQALTVINQ